MVYGYYMMINANIEKLYCYDNQKRYEQGILVEYKGKKIRKYELRRIDYTNE